MEGRIDGYFEKDLVINGRELVYKGVFDPPELFSTINRSLEERGYIKREKKTEEIVKEEGKQTKVELRPYKVITNYAHLVLKIKIILDNVTEEYSEHKGHKRKFNKGDVLLIFDGWVLTDYQHRWGMKPLVYFLKGVINKFIYTTPLEGNLPGELSQDAAFVYKSIKNLLQSYKFESGKKMKEEEIMEKVAEEMD